MEQSYIFIVVVFTWLYAFVKNSQNWILERVNYIIYKLYLNPNWGKNGRIVITCHSEGSNQISQSYELPDHLGDHPVQRSLTISEFSTQRGLGKRHAHGPLCKSKGPLVPLSDSCEWADELGSANSISFPEILNLENMWPKVRRQWQVNFTVSTAVAYGQMVLCRELAFLFCSRELPFFLLLLLPRRSTSMNFTYNGYSKFLLFVSHETWWYR